MSRRGRDATGDAEPTHGIVVELADTYWRRLRGMLGRRRLPDALLLTPGASVHGVGMTRSLDVAMLGDMDPRSGGFAVLSTTRLRPFGLVLAPRGTRTVLEAPVGSFARWDLRAGDAVRLAAHGELGSGRG